MKCLILAAGKGSRLAARGDSKPLIRLLGLSLIERTILTARSCGLTEFYGVTGYNGQEVRDFLEEFSRRENIKIDHIINDEWQKENGLSVLKEKELLNEEFVLLMSDHIFDDRILKELVRHDQRCSVVLAVDRRKALPGDTKVLEVEGRIVDTGKNIEKSNCIDTGIFLCRPKIFSYIEEAVSEGRTELAEAIAKAAKNRDAQVFDITQIESYASKMRKDIKPWWIDIDTEEDMVKAGEMIIENASKNPSDALACYVHKPIENKLVASISNFIIKPNQLTVIVNVFAYTVTILYIFCYLLHDSLLCFVLGNAVVFSC